MITNTQGLQVSQLAYNIGETSILKNVSFSLNKGENIALLGTNGSGKTTLLNCLTGFYPCTDGEILWNGKKLEKIPQKELCNYVSHCGDAPAPFYECTVAEILLFGLSSKAGFWGSYSSHDHDLVLQFAKLFELTHLLERNYPDLSLGEMQRTNLAMSLVAEPDFLLLDEPTSHLDPYFQKKLIDCIINLSHNQNTGIIAVLHDINHAIFFDRVIILNGGIIELEGIPYEILTHKNLNNVFGEGVFKTIGSGSEKVNLLSI